MDSRSLILASLLAVCLTLAKASATTTPTPGPQAQYDVHNATTKCILASMGGMFAVTYKKKSGATDTAMLYIPDQKTTSVNSERSYCYAGTTSMSQAITLTWANSTNNSTNFNLTIRFTPMDSRVVVDMVSLEYDLRDDKVFPDADISMKPQRTANSNGLVTVLNITKGTYLKCDTGEKFQLMDTTSNLTVNADLKYVKLDAFRVSNSSTFDDMEAACSGDQMLVGTYSVMNANGTSCLLAEFDMNLDVLYFNASDNGKVFNKTFSSLNNGTVNQMKSHCDINGTSLLVIEDFLPLWELAMYFMRNGDKYSMNKVYLSYSLANFPNANDTAWLNSTTTNLDVFGAHLNKSYKCSQDPILKLNVSHSPAVSEINFRLDKVHVQAFNQTSGSWNDAEVCSSDNGGGDTSEIVPIAVGCALAALVIIVLIAYVIGRRRNRARGYESM